MAQGGERCGRFRRGDPRASSRPRGNAQQDGARFEVASVEGGGNGSEDDPAKMGGRWGSWAGGVVRRAASRKPEFGVLGRWGPVRHLARQPLTRRENGRAEAPSWLRQQCDGGSG